MIGTHIISIFKWGMKRDIVPPIEPLDNEAPILHLGAGNTKQPWPDAWADRVVDLDLPGWDANSPGRWNNLDDESVAGIFAFHFLEHLEDPAGFLYDTQRILMPGAPFTIIVPFYNTQGAVQDLTHKHFFCEDTWKILMQNEYWDTSMGEGRKWQLAVGTNILIGIAERNVALMTQLIKS